MFIHLGSDRVIGARDLVAILDARITRHSRDVRELVQLARGEGRLVHITDGPPKALVIASDQVVLSPIAPATLGKRARPLHGLDAITRR